MAQHARSNYRLEGANGTTGINGKNEKRVLVPYDNDAATTGSPVNAANQPRGLSNGGYTLLWSDEFTGSSFQYNSLGQLGNTANPPNWNLNWFFEDNKNVARNGQPVNINGYPFDLVIDPGLAYLNGNQMVTAANFSTDNLGRSSYRGTLQHSTTQFMYGYVEARIKITKNLGAWPAFWLYSENSALCKRSEIDIFEYTMQGDYKEPKEFCRPSVNQHYPAPGLCPVLVDSAEMFKYIAPMDDATIGAYFLDMSQDYFIYGCEWSPGQVKYYINNTLVATQSQKISNLPVRILFGVGLTSANPVQVPMEMRTEYIRLYKHSSYQAKILDNMPASVCRGGQLIGFTIPDYAHDLTYTWTVTPPVGGINPPTVTTWFEGLWGNIGGHIAVPANATIGNYTVTMNVVKAGVALFSISKVLKVQGSVTSQPGTITSAHDCLECILSINAVPNALDYQWKIDGVISPEISTTCSIPLGNHAIEVRSRNSCGLSSARTATINCVKDCHSMQQRAASVVVVSGPELAAVDSTLTDTLTAFARIQPNPVQAGQPVTVTLSAAPEAAWQATLLSGEGVAVAQVKGTGQTAILPTVGLKPGLYTVQVLAGTPLYTLHLSLVESL